MARKTSSSNRYVVRDADIWTAAGRVNVGEVVELEGAEARHFNTLGYLAPYIPDDEATEEEIGEVEADVTA